MSTHTPGPWRTMLIGPNRTDRGTAMVATTFYEGMAIDCMDSGKNWSESAANARLIAAAPDLLAACKDALDAGNDGDWQSADKVLRAAIKKAGGSE